MTLAIRGFQWLYTGIIAPCIEHHYISVCRRLKLVLLRKIILLSIRIQCKLEVIKHCSRNYPSMETIHIDYYMLFFISYTLSALDHDIVTNKV